MPMANLTKIFVLFKASFWLEAGFSGEVVSNGGASKVQHCDKGPVAIFFDATTQLGTPALVAFMAGKASDQWNDQTLDVLQEAILCQLDSYYGHNKVRSAFDRFIKRNWASDPFVNGGLFLHSQVHKV